MVCENILEWGRWHQTSREQRQLARDEFEMHGEQVLVSTVFLGINHNWGEGPPILWGTMIFGGPHDEYQERYSSRAEALEGHARAVRIAKGEIRLPTMDED